MTELTDNLLAFLRFICGCCSSISAIQNTSYNRLLVLLFSFLPEFQEWETGLPIR